MSYFVGSGQITNSMLMSGGLGSGAVASGSILSGQIASGQIGTVHVSSGGLGSGAIGSGQIGSAHIASGAVIAHARDVFEDSYTTAETISGVRCVRVTASGLLQIAMAAVSGRMPAHGVAVTNALGGAALSFIRLGQTLGVASEMGSGLCVSGRQGSTIWVGASGEVVTISGGGPTVGIGATNSGAQGQIMGWVTNSGAITVQADNTVYSGEAVVTTDTRFWPL